MENDERIYFKCGCGSEVVCIEKYMDDTYGFCIFRRTPETSIIHRLRNAWLILRGAELYSDDLVIEKNQIKGMVDFLNKALE